MYIVKNCRDCPRDCNKQRSLSTGAGFCKMGMKPKIARVSLHHWEEPCISGENGSGTIFFSGCNMHCIYCQNYNISTMNKGTLISINKLADIYKELEEMGVHNINLVTPTHFSYTILKSFEMYKPKIPIIYNSSGYEKVDTLKHFEGVVDVYLVDIKYYDRLKSKKYSNIDNYFEIASSAIKEMFRQTGEVVFDSNGIINKGIIIRHLILPISTKDSIKILEWIKCTFNKSILVSLMSQYTPLNDLSNFQEINRKITKREYEKVLNKFIELELNGYVQELSSANKCYIPDF